MQSLVLQQDSRCIHSFLRSNYNVNEVEDFNLTIHLQYMEKVDLLKIINGFEKLLRADERSKCVARVVWDALRRLEGNNAEQTTRRLI